MVDFYNYVGKLEVGRRVSKVEDVRTGEGVRKLEKKVIAKGY